MTLKSDAKFEEKLTLGSKNDERNLVNFNGSSSKIENLHFDVLGEFKKYVCSRFSSFEDLSHPNCPLLFSSTLLPHQGTFVLAATHPLLLNFFTCEI